MLSCTVLDSLVLSVSGPSTHEMGPMLSGIVLIVFITLVVWIHEMRHMLSGTVLSVLVVLFWVAMTHKMESILSRAVLILSFDLILVSMAHRMGPILSRAVLLGFVVLVVFVSVVCTHEMRRMLSRAVLNVSVSVVSTQGIGHMLSRAVHITIISWERTIGATVSLHIVAISSNSSCVGFSISIIINIRIDWH